MSDRPSVSRDSHGHYIAFEPVGRRPSPTPAARSRAGQLNPAFPSPVPSRALTPTPVPVSGGPNQNAYHMSRSLEEGRGGFQRSPSQDPQAGHELTAPQAAGHARPFNHMHMARDPARPYMCNRPRSALCTVCGVLFFYSLHKIWDTQVQQGAASGAF